MSAENPATDQGAGLKSTIGSGAYLHMRMFFKSKSGGFKLSLVVGKLRFALDYPSS